MQAIGTAQQEATRLPDPAADPQDVAGAGDLDPFLASPLARVVLARARMRAVMPLDVVTFVAACPACGRDCEWTQERQETRLRSTVGCPCVDED